MKAAISRILLGLIVVGACCFFYQYFWRARVIGSAITEIVWAPYAGSADGERVVWLNDAGHLFVRAIHQAEDGRYLEKRYEADLKEIDRIAIIEAVQAAISIKAKAEYSSKNERIVHFHERLFVLYVKKRNAKAVLVTEDVMPTWSLVQGAMERLESAASNFQDDAANLRFENYADFSWKPERMTSSLEIEALIQGKP